MTIEMLKAQLLPFYFNSRVFIFIPCYFMCVCVLIWLFPQNLAESVSKPKRNLCTINTPRAFGRDQMAAAGPIRQHGLIGVGLSAVFLGSVVGRPD